jgi:polar amino acid transport system substrate-binding protein
MASGHGSIRLKKMFIILIVCLVVFLCLPHNPVGQLNAQAATAPSSHPKSLKTATYGWRPFIYEETGTGIPTYTGLDLRLATLIFRKIGIDIKCPEEMSWDNLLTELKEGEKDIVISALPNQERFEYAYYSDTFRLSVNVLYVRKGDIGKYKMTDDRNMLRTWDMLMMFKEKSFRLGVVGGYSYGDVQIDGYISDPANSSRIVRAQNDESLFHILEKGDIDGFLIDQIVGADIAYKKHLEHIADEYPITISQLPYYVIFSKKTTTPELVKKFNLSMAQIKASGEYSKLVQEYLFPVLLGFTTGQAWFYFVELTGVICFSLSGILIAKKDGYDITGALVLAAMPGVGGGIVRDLIARREHLGIQMAPAYLFAVILTVFIAYIVININEKLKVRKASSPFLTKFEDFIERIPFNAIVEILDALGLSTLSIIGVVVALETKNSPLWLWGPLFAAITSAGGGIMRDIVRGDFSHPSLKGSFYPEIALIWGFILSIFLLWYSNRLNYYPNEIFAAVMTVIAGSFLTRVLAVLFKWRVAPFCNNEANKVCVLNKREKVEKI